MKAHSPVWGVLAALAVIAGTAPGCAAEEKAVFSADFEVEEPASPPAGWVMWGADRYKNPANYTRDTTNPHAGKGCFRIHHPAGTAGYVVSDPQHAVRPRQGMRYTVSFWARTDKPEPSSFGLTAYESIAPYKDAPSPGSSSIEVGMEWKQYTFTFDEGWDFFSERSRYLLLTLHATRDEKAEKTLWLDDVSVAESESPRKDRLVDESALKYEPVQHRLRPGETLQFSVDAKKRLRRATRDAGGVSFHRVVGWSGLPYKKAGEYTLKPELEEAIREMRLPMTRFYGVGDEAFGLEGGLDRVAEICRRVGVAPEHTVVELETQGATTKIAPEVWARGARYALQKGCNFRFWEVANEPYSGMWGSGGAFPTSDAYADHVKAVSAAIRAVQPGAQIGIGIHPDNQKWGNYVLKRAAGSYDFVAGHFYAFGDIHRRKFEASVLTENYRRLDRIARLNALLRAYNPGREVYQYDTEWGMHAGGRNGERADYVDRNANIIGTLHRAVRLIYYAREEILRGASSWQMLSGTGGQGFGILSQQAPEKRFLLYWLYYYFNRHVGAWALDLEGTAPYYAPAQGDDPAAKPGEFAGPLTPALATLSEDGKTLFLVCVNASWERPAPCRVQLRNFRPAGATGVVLSHGDLDGKPLLERKEDAVADLPVTVAGQEITCTLPPHSAVFVTIAGK